MFSTDFLYQQDEFIIGLWFFTALIAASEIGYWLGLWRAGRASAAGADPKVSEDDGAPAASTTTTTTNEAGDASGTEAHVIQVLKAVLAVLGLLLAFTVSMAVSRYDARKQALVTETNAIKTAYLRAQLLSDSQRTAIVALLRQYVDARLATDRPDWNTDTALQNKIAALQQQIWSQSMAIGQQDPQSDTVALYIQSVNEMFDAQSARDTARLDTLPGSALDLQFAVAMLGLGILGYSSGLGRGRSLVSTILLALLITVVVVIIIDLDQPYRGFITISQQSLFQLRQSMGP
jgi:hypothetical protein